MDRKQERGRNDEFEDRYDPSESHRRHESHRDDERGRYEQGSSRYGHSRDRERERDTDRYHHSERGDRDRDRRDDRRGSDYHSRRDEHSKVTTKLQEAFLPSDEPDEMKILEDIVRLTPAQKEFIQNTFLRAQDYFSAGSQDHEALFSFCSKFANVQLLMKKGERARQEAKRQEMEES